MCPPYHFTPAAEIGEYWTDEGICMSLVKFKSGCPLPPNVISDVNPYQFKPADLPADMWYYCSGVKKDAKSGFWRATGEACEIFSNSAITGLRTTLQFYEGEAPNGEKTNWLMQEYRTTEKCNRNLKDPRALCRVFLADENRIVLPELPARHGITDIDDKNTTSLGLKTVSNVKNGSEQFSDSELLKKNMDNGIGPSLVAKSSPEPDPPAENFSEMDCVLMDDYIELNDLADPVSRSSSSANSSCLTMTSEEYFDSMALLRELADDSMDREMKDSNVKFNLSASVKPKEVVLHPAALETLRSGKENKPYMDKASEVKHTAGNEQDAHGSKSSDTAASSSGSKGTSKQETKDRVRQTKRRRMMKYLCFLAF